MWIGPVRIGKAVRLGAVALCLLGVVACDSAPEDSASAQTQGAAKRLKDDKASSLAARMVSAVGANGDKSMVDVRFELTQRPEVGKPVDISLVFIPGSALERLYAKFTSADGVEVVKGEETEQFARPVVGAALTHTVTVVPKRNGIFSVQALVLMDSETESISRSFAIPFIAGSGIAEWSPKKAGAGGDDTG
jgi:hypothetical protein